MFFQNIYLTLFDLHYINTYNNFHVIQLFFLNNINFSWHYLCKLFFIIFILLCIIIVIALHNIYQYTKAQSKTCKEPRGISLPIHYKYSTVHSYTYSTLNYNIPLYTSFKTHSGYWTRFYSKTLYSMTLSPFKLYIFLEAPCSLLAQFKAHIWLPACNYQLLAG